MNCPICDNADARTASSNGGHLVECPRCGEFRITNKAMSMWQNILGSAQNKERLIGNASSWVFRRQKELINPGKIDLIREVRTPSFYDRADMLLLALEAETSYAGQRIELRTPDWQARAWCMNEDELYEIILYLASEGRLHDAGEMGTNAIKILPKGWAHLDLLRTSKIESPFAFVAMSFSESMTATYDEAIAPAISSAGYKPLRVDREEHLGKIDDFVIANIRRARFMVADLTDQRQSVYFEAGFATGLNLPVVYTCQKDEIENMHFDIRQFICIAWDKHEDFLELLKNRIVAVIGQGNYAL